MPVSLVEISKPETNHTTARDNHPIPGDEKQVSKSILLPYTIIEQ